MNQITYDLDLLGQQPLLNLYTQISLCFSVVDASSHSIIVDTLNKGLAVLAESFPWTAGEVINEGSGKDDSGVFKIKRLETVPSLVVKDLTQDASMPTMDALRRAGFPSSMLDEAVIAPRRTVPGSPDERDLHSKPVFLVQATFIVGGLILTFVGQHNSMDMIGQGELIRLLSKACHGKNFTGEEVSSGNIDRRHVIPLLDAKEAEIELSHKVPSQVSDTKPEPVSPPKCAWAHLIFSKSSLAALKSHAMESISTSYVSTDDVLSAFVWQSITRVRLARLARLGSTRTSRFARAVDVRRYLGISPTYLGLAQNMTYHVYTLQQLVEEPLGHVASQLRAALDPSTSRLAQDTRAMATILNHTKDKSSISFMSTIDPATDIALSSWAKLDCYKLDFNLELGTPEAVRRPQFIPFEGLMYLLPKALNGEIAVALCLRNEDMDRLRSDKEFIKYATYVG